MTIWVLMTQAKNNQILETLLSQNQIGSAKQILKKVPIPSYILLNLNKNPKLGYNYNQLTDAVWQKLTEKSLNKALIRVNKIFNKIDSISLNKIGWMLSQI